MVVPGGAYPRDSSIKGYDTLEGRICDLDRLIQILQDLLLHQCDDIEQIGTMVDVINQYSKRVKEIFYHKEEAQQEAA